MRSSSVNRFLRLDFGETPTIVCELSGNSRVTEVLRLVNGYSDWLVEGDWECRRPANRYYSASIINKHGSVIYGDCGSETPFTTHYHRGLSHRNRSWTGRDLLDSQHSVRGTCRPGLCERKSGSASGERGVERHGICASIQTGVTHGGQHSVVANGEGAAEPALQ